MIDDPEILKKLSVLASEKAVFRDGARVISNGLVSPLAALLDEIDNTTLKRILTFRADDSFVSLLVAGRRVLTLLATSDNFEDSDPFVNVPLTREDDETFEAVAAILFRFADQQMGIAVESTPADITAGRNEIGVSCARLAQLLEVDLDVEHPKPVQNFVEACEDLFTACLFETNGSWTGQAQDEAVLLKLQNIADTQWADFRERHEKHTQSSKQPNLIVLHGVVEGAELTAATWAQGEATIFACNQSDFDEIHRIWRSLVTF